MFAIHPDYVDAEGHASLCDTCHRTLITHSKVPRYSIRAGYDMGRRPRNLVELNLAEKLVIARARLYVTVVKVTAAVRRLGGLKFTKHTIVFQHDAPDVVASALPRLSVDATQLSIMFVGTKDQLDAARRRPANGGPSKLESLVGGIVRVRAEVVFAWLLWLKAVNPGYEHIDIAPQSRDVLSALESIGTTLLDNVTLVDNDTAVRMEATLCSGPTADIARARVPAGGTNHDDADVSGAGVGAAHPADLEADVDDDVGVGDQDGAHAGGAEEPPGGSSLVYRTGSAAGAAVCGNPCAAYLAAVAQTIDNSGDAAAAHAGDDAAAAATAPAVMSSDTGGAAVQERRQQPLVSRRDAAPVNEFTHNADLYYDAFPDIFPLRAGMPASCNGSLAIAFTRHLLLQASRFPARDARLLYLMFNQIQRAAAARAACALVNADADSTAAFVELVNGDGFLVRLRHAMQNPDGEDARALVQQLQRYIRVTTARIPYSPQQRELSMTHIIALTQHFGMPAWYVTIAPADLHHPLVWRLAVGLDPPSALRDHIVGADAMAQRAAETAYRSRVQRMVREASFTVC